LKQLIPLALLEFINNIFSFEDCYTSRTTKSVLWDSSQK